jgi:hypothetical protein
MKASQFYALVALMYITPHMHQWVAAGAFVVFGLLSLACMYWGKE